MHQGLNELFDFVWLQYSSTAQNALAFGSCLLACDSHCKLLTRSKKAHFTPLVHNILLFAWTSRLPAIGFENFLNNCPALCCLHSSVPELIFPTNGFVLIFYSNIFIPKYEICFSRLFKCLRFWIYCSVIIYTRLSIVPLFLL